MSVSQECNHLFKEKPHACQQNLQTYDVDRVWVCQVWGTSDTNDRSTSLGLKRRKIRYLSTQAFLRSVGSSEPYGLMCGRALGCVKVLRMHTPSVNATFMRPTGILFSPRPRNCYHKRDQQALQVQAICSNLASLRGGGGGGGRSDKP